jgi:glutathione S-transferase
LYTLFVQTIIRWIIYGTGSLERASIEQWLQAEAQSFDAPSSELVFQLAFAPHLKDVNPDEARIAENEKKLQNMLGVYDETLSKHNYLAGDEFTLADLSHLPNSHYIVNSSDRGRKLFTAKKHVAKWYEKIASRESWRQVVKMQNEHLSARSSDRPADRRRCGSSPAARGFDRQASLP